MEIYCIYRTNTEFSMVKLCEKSRAKIVCNN